VEGEADVAKRQFLLKRGTTMDKNARLTFTKIQMYLIGLTLTKFDPY
jgi:hypothetical protein